MAVHRRKSSEFRKSREYEPSLLAEAELHGEYHINYTAIGDSRIISMKRLIINQHLAIAKSEASPFHCATRPRHPFADALQPLSKEHTQAAEVRFLAPTPHPVWIVILPAELEEPPLLPSYPHSRLRKKMHRLQICCSGLDEQHSVRE